jgi:serine/threonine protein kinase/Tol biopolymer transport system component
VLGPYEVVDLVGEGGMGAVYRAKDTRLGRFVAIKVLTNVNFSDRERLQRFEQEARATGILNHPNLLTIYDVGTDRSGAPFLVSELLEGETLRGRLERGPLSPRKAVDAALQMAQGLAAAHEKGVVHRDLKPDNIFLTRDGRLKILDFGIAKLTGAAGSDGPTFQMTATEPGMVLGTVGYMSPEQVRGEPVDHRSDLFALGAIFYEMLSGIRAFKRNSSIETLNAILKEEPPDLTDMLPSLPPAVERLVRRCLEKDRDQRFQSARDLAFNLETLSAMSSSSTLAGVVRTSGASNAIGGPETRTTPLHSPTATRTSATAALPRTQTIARPVMKPKRRVSMVLLALLYLVSIAGAAYGAWMFARRTQPKPPETLYRRMTFRRGEVRTARFTPDGETIVYSAAWDGNPSETFVVSRTATEARPLGIAESEVLAVSKSAELAILLHRDRFTNVGVLARVPLAGGTPREVADNVIAADWSPDGSNLAIVRIANGKIRIEYPIGNPVYEAVASHVRIAPDGKRLAILERLQGENNLTIIDNGKANVVARGWSRGATGLAWAPDGKSIWVSGTSTAAPAAVYAVSLDDSTMRLTSRLTGLIRLFDISTRGETLMSHGTWRAALVWKPGGLPVSQSPGLPATATDTTGQPGDRATGEPERDASWLDWSILADLSPNGRTILFSETREGGGAKSAVYLRRLESPTPVRLGDGIADGLSPDTKWVLAHQGPKLMILPTGMGEPRELKLNGVFEAGAAWMPDSKRAVLGGAVGKEGFRLHVVDTLDETTKPLTPEGIWNGGSREFAVSPDGRFVAGMSADQTIAIYAADGSGATPVTSAEKGEVPIQWSADGAALYVYRPTALPARIFRITLATGAREPWKELMLSDPAGVFKISPLLITPDGGGYAYTAMRTLSDLYAVEGLQ